MPRDIRLPRVFPMDAFSESPDPRFEQPPEGAPWQSPLPQNPVPRTLVHGFENLSVSSSRVHTPRSDNSDGFVGYEPLYGDHFVNEQGDYFVNERRDDFGYLLYDGYERTSTAESNVRTWNNNVNGGTWYPRFHEYGSCPGLSGTSIASRGITESNLRNGLINSRLSRQAMQHSDVFGPDRNSSLLDSLAVYSRELLRRSSSVGRSAGINTSPQRLSIELNQASIKDFRGRIKNMAKNQNCSRILTEKMDTMKGEEAQLVYAELIEHIGELMVDPCANYVIQKLIDVGSDGQRAGILSAVTRNPQLITICLDQYGTRVMQKLLENLTPNWQKQEFVSAISPGVIQLAKNTNGHHVIQHCLNVFPAKYNKVLLDRLADNFYELATDQSGCCVVTHHIQNVKGERSDRVVAATIAHAFPLAEHCFGNYVVQNLLSTGMPQQLLNDVHQQFIGSYAALSSNKFGSNVVEKCLGKAEDRDFMQIICELFDDFLMLLTDEFGNYVAQTIIRRSKDLHLPIHDVLVDTIRACRPLIQGNLYGMKALERLAKNNIYI